MRTHSIAWLISALAVAALAAPVSAEEGSWISHGPGGVAEVSDVLVVDETAYAATLNGVFRSDDGGTTWQPSGLQRLPIVRLLARPGAPEILALLGEGIATLYSSKDAGVSWQAVPAPPFVTAAGIDPSRPSRFYAQTADGQVWRSEDSGATWQNVSTLTGLTEFAFGSGGIYALSSGYLYKSRDAGATWTRVEPPGFFSSAVAVGRETGVVYVAGSLGLCRSADSAATWTCVSSAPLASRILELAGSSGSAPRLILATDTGVRISSDGGTTWAPGSPGVGSARVHALGSDASGSLLLAGTDTRVFLSQDHGDTWSDHSAGLQSIWSSGLALARSDPMTVWTGGFGFYPSGPGLFRSVDGGLSWSPAGGSQGPAGRSIRSIALDPEQSSTIYVGAADVLLRSDDGGATWTAPLDSSAEAIAIDPRSPEKVLAGGAAGVARSADRGQTWQASSLTQGVYSLLFDPRDSNRVYAGSYWDIDSGYSEIFGGSIFVSNDGGATFTKGSTEFGNPVYGIAADPFQKGVLYAGGRGVFRSTDDGDTWRFTGSGLNPPNPYFLIAPDMQVLRIVADPIRPGTLYCSTTYDLFRSTDGGETWETFSDGLQPLEVVELAISPDGTRLHAGTAGGGVFERELSADLTLPCVPSAARLCLVGGRYAIDLYAAYPEGGVGASAARSLGDRAGYFALPRATGDAELPEVVVKMLPEGSFGGPGEGAPVFYASLTTLPYWLTVTDTNLGTRRIYASRSDAPLCGAADLAMAASARMTTSPVRSAVSLSANVASLIGGRFSVSLEARRPGAAPAVRTLEMTSGDSYAFFSFPDLTGDPQFPEVVVKMVDGRALDGHFWFFHTGLTTLAYTLTVTDSVTGEARTYDSARPFCGASDTESFIDDPWGY